GLAAGPVGTPTGAGDVCAGAGTWDPCGAYGPMGAFRFITSSVACQPKKRAATTHKALAHARITDLKRNGTAFPNAPVLVLPSTRCDPTGISGMYQMWKNLVATWKIPGTSSTLPKRRNPQIKIIVALS